MEEKCGTSFSWKTKALGSSKNEKNCKAAFFCVGRLRDFDLIKRKKIHEETRLPQRSFVIFTLLSLISNDVNIPSFNNKKTVSTLARQTFLFHKQTLPEKIFLQLQMHHCEKSTKPSTGNARLFLESLISINKLFFTPFSMRCNRQKNISRKMLNNELN